MDISDMKNQLADLKKELNETQKHTTEQRINNLEKELNEMKERYISLLEHTLELKGNRKSESSNKSSTRTPEVQLDKFQLLLLLYKSKATSPEFSVSANQLKQAFNINKTSRTIRDKLTSLELMNLINSIGQKPKNYFLTPRGIQMISQQQKGLMEVH